MKFIFFLEDGEQATDGGRLNAAWSRADYEC